MVHLVAVLLVLSTTALPIGLQGGIGIDAINNFKDQALPAILKEATLSDYPTITKTVGKSYFTLTLQVRELKFSELSVNAKDSKVTFVSPNRIQVDMKQLTGAASFRWLYDTPMGNDEGIGKLALIDAYSSLIISLAEAEGRLIVTVEDAVASIGDINIEFSNNPTAETMNWVVNSFKFDIQEALLKQLNTSLGEETQEFFDYIFQGPSTVIPFGDGSPLGIDYALPKAPLVSNSYIEVYSLGVIVELDQPNSEPPIDLPVELPAFRQGDGQIQVSVSEYTLNSGLYATVNSDKAKFTITNEMLPSIVRLNTQTLENFLPGIKQKYGDNKDCELQCTVAEYPTVNLMPDSVVGTSTFVCGVYVIKAKETAVELSLTTNFKGSFSIEDWKVVGKIDSIEVEAIDLISSTIDNLSTTGDLKNLLNTALKISLITISSSIFGQGIPLPTFKGLNVEDSKLEIHEGFLQIETTPQYDFSV